MVKIVTLFWNTLGYFLPLHNPSHLLAPFLLPDALLFKAALRPPNLLAPFLMTPHTSGLSATSWLINAQWPREYRCLVVEGMLIAECLDVIRLLYKHDGM